MGQANVEIRTFALSINNIEERGDKKQRTLIGHAAVFNTYADIGRWEERILPGAFSDAIGRDDVRALFNHEPNLILARNNSKVQTFRMHEDERGLAVEIDIPDTQLGRDLEYHVERGDIDQMSFAFSVNNKDENYVKWIRSDDKDIKDKRDIIKVSKLWDVSPVTYPAFDTTDISVRSYEEWKKRTDTVSRKAYYRWKVELERRSI